jgi:hypothetical protein
MHKRQPATCFLKSLNKNTRMATHWGPAKNAEKNAARAKNIHVVSHER